MRYLKKRRCVKCGSTGTKDQHVNFKQLPEMVSGIIFGDCVKNCQEGEHIHRRCNNCGYKWSEDPLKMNTIHKPTPPPPKIIREGLFSFWRKP
jgi:ferredoxin